MANISIYNKNGVLIKEVLITDKSERKQSLQADNYVNLGFALTERIGIGAGAYIDYLGQRFYRVEDYYPQRKGQHNYEYDVKFQAAEALFIKPIFFRYIELSDGSTWKEPEFNINGNLATLAGLIVTAVNRADLGITITLPEGNEYDKTELKALTFTGINIQEAIAIIADTFETEWWLDDTVLHFDRCEKGDYIELSDIYSRTGSGDVISGGLKSYTVSSKQTNVPQRIFPYGAERNIVPESSMNISFRKRLHLDQTLYPNGYLEVEGVTSGIEEVKIFDEIYPRRVGHLSSVRERVTNGGMTIYYVKDDSIDFDPAALLIDGCTMMIRFVSGYLNGWDFECNYLPSTDEFEIINSQDNDQIVPFGTFIPRGRDDLDNYEGDEYVLFNMEMPQSYVTAAQAELAEKAQEYVDTLQTGIPDISCVSDELYFREHGTAIFVGSKIRLMSDEFAGGFVQSRVTAFDYKLTKPYAISFTLAEARSGGKMASIANKINEQASLLDGVYQDSRAISARGWRDANELANMIESVRTELILVGDPDNQFTTTCFFQANYRNDKNSLFISSGQLHHVKTDNVREGTWDLETSTIFVPNIINPFYIYARCSKESDNGSFLLSSERLNVNGEDANEGYYMLLCGVLSSIFDDKRTLNITSGFTQIAGGSITTEKIQDTLKRLIIDLSSNPPKITATDGAEICGNIKFLTANNEYKTVEDGIDDATGYLTNALPQDTEVDGGVILSSLIQVRNNAQNVTAGMNGNVNSTGLHTPAFWAGGNLQNAIGDIANVILRHDGTGKIGSLSVENGMIRINLDNAGGGYATLSSDGIRVFDSLGAPRAKIISGDIYKQSIVRETEYQFIPNGIMGAYTPMGQWYWGNLSDPYNQWVSKPNTMHIVCLGGFDIAEVYEYDQLSALFNLKINQVSYVRRTIKNSNSQFQNDVEFGVCLYVDYGSKSPYSQEMTYGNNIFTEQYFKAKLPEDAKIISVKTITPTYNGNETIYYDDETISQFAFSDESDSKYCRLMLAVATKREESHLVSGEVFGVDFGTTEYRKNIEIVNPSTIIGRNGIFSAFSSSKYFGAYNDANGFHIIGKADELNLTQN